MVFFNISVQNKYVRGSKQMYSGHHAEIFLASTNGHNRVKTVHTPHLILIIQPPLIRCVSINIALKSQNLELHVVLILK